MISKTKVGGRLTRLTLATALGTWFLAVSPGIAEDAQATRTGYSPNQAKIKKTKPSTKFSGSGTLGYGAPGLHPGFQGFGLGYHLGYGYGGNGLGVGANGGYPLYGGPGYPHPSPTLRRVGGITPFCYFGGPGYPSPDHPNIYGPVSPLSPDQPVVTFERDPVTPISDSGYGAFDGTLPNPQ